MDDVIFTFTRCGLLNSDEIAPALHCVHLSLCRIYRKFHFIFVSCASAQLMWISSECNSRMCVVSWRPKQMRFRLIFNFQTTLLYPVGWGQRDDKRFLYIYFQKHTVTNRIKMHKNPGAPTTGPDNSNSKKNQQQRHSREFIKLVRRARRSVVQFRLDIISILPFPVRDKFHPS